MCAFSPNSVSTLRCSYGRSKGRCLIRVLTLVCGILRVNVCKKWFLWHLDMRFDCAGSHKVCVAGSGLRHFSCISVKSGSCEILTCVSTAQALHRGPGPQHFIFPAHFRIKWPLWNVDLHFDCASLPRDLLWRSCTDILRGHLLWRPCVETLHRDLLRRDLYKRSWSRDLL